MYGVSLMTEPTGEAELLAKRAAYIDTLRGLHRRERLVGFFLILAGYALIAAGWVFFVYVIWRRTAWRRANPFDPKA